jgi:hypothetical protein
VLAGQYLADNQVVPNMIPQIWRDGTWTDVGPLPDGSSFDLYPRVHADSADRVFMSGPRGQSWSLDPRGGGAWTRGPLRAGGLRDYAPAVEYAPGRFLFIGGGNDPQTHQPTAEVWTTNVHAPHPQWTTVAPMHSARRQHNATLLPDGTVLVTGGTRGGGGPDPQVPGFNDLSPGQPVHTAELWDPVTGAWTELTAERVDRCYHSTAVLLLDGRVLSAGGGEYRPVGDVENDPADSHRDAQVFSPPYLFAGARPVITSAPDAVSYGETFEVVTPDAAAVARVSLVAPSSVTHAWNMHQRLVLLASVGQVGKLRVTAPASPDDCPPGYYMLFLISATGVPSRARFIRVKASIRQAALRALAVTRQAKEPAPARAVHDEAVALQTAVRQGARGILTVIGLASTCPYGIGACWGGAHEALLNLEGVSRVDPVPDVESSTATVFFEGGPMPPLDRWLEQFHGMVNGSYLIRGVEVTFEGALDSGDDDLYLALSGHGATVRLVPLTAGAKVQWDRSAAAPQPVEPEEESAFSALTEVMATTGPGAQVRVTGPLTRAPDGYRLHVRRFEASSGSRDDAGPVAR